MRAPSRCSWVLPVSLVLGLMLVACSANEAKSLMPTAKDLCCHGNWGIQALEGEKQEGICSKNLLPDADPCYYREFYNQKIRFGEPEDLWVSIGVMENVAAAERWLEWYEPPTFDGLLSYREAVPPLVGDRSLAWDLVGDEYWGTEAAYVRDNLAVIVFAGMGSRDERDVMFDSVDEAILDRILGYD